jgi:hypothetical protein
MAQTQESQRDPVRTFRASERDWRLLQLVARARGVSASEVIREAVRGEIERELGDG